MTDAQPAEQVVTALRKAEGWLLADPEPTPILRADLAAIRAALPIAREMAERERELVAALERIVTTNDCDCYWSHFAECASEIARVALDRARAAGVEVTGHE